MSDFKITGPGEYRTRRGEKMEVIGSFNGRWVGFPSDTEELEIPVKIHRFYDNGKFSERELVCDIIGPWVEPTVDKSTSTDHAKLIASLELASRHNECAELLLDAAAEIRRLHSLMEEQAAHNGLGAGSIPAASTKE
jgi:hypothetical protein